jgi:uncharacterized protein with GYD domain
MATFFMFGRYSQEAINGMGSGRTEKAGKLVERFGGKINSIYALTGDTDLVIIATFPGVENAVKASIGLTKLTGIAFTTSEAITVEDFDKMIVDI